MIAKLTGVIDEILEDSIIVDVNGVGYQVYVTSSLLHGSSVGAQISVRIEHIIKQDAQFLCGFQTKEEIGVFRVLLNVHGIGVRSALAILSALTISEIATAIATQDASLLSKVSGIGQKTAERILLELKDKTVAEIKDVTYSNNENIQDAMLGLISLGYKKNDILPLLQRISKELGSTASANDLIFRTLKEVR